jgi:hypothetical protein
MARWWWWFDGTRTPGLSNGHRPALSHIVLVGEERDERDERGCSAVVCQLQVSEQCFSLLCRVVEHEDEMSSESFTLFTTKHFTLSLSSLFTLSLSTLF